MNERFWFFRPNRAWMAAVVFIHDWWYSRPLRSLLRALPALSVMAGMAALIGLGASSNKPRLIQRYKSASSAAIEREDFQTAEICLRKLAVLEPDNSQHRFTQGLIAERKEDFPEARRIMHRLASADKTGYAPAHFWQAVRLLEEKEKTPESLQLAHTHLLRTVDADPAHVKAHALLGQSYMSQRQPERAAAHLARVARVIPAVRVPLARVYVMLGQKNNAREQAGAARRHFADVVARNRENVSARLEWTKSELFLEEFASAEQILKEGRELDPANEALRNALAQVYSVWSDHLPRTESVRRFELLAAACQLVPNEPTVLQQLGSLAGQENPNWKSVRALLRAALTDEKAAGVAHLILGTTASAERDYEQALMHLEEAFRRNPKSSATANNLAWVLANIAPPQLDRAIELANVAVELAPRNPEIRETRGQILLKMEAWKDALADLEIAAEAIPDRTSIHASLAKAYDQLGNAALAERHRELSGQANITRIK